MLFCETSFSLFPKLLVLISHLTLKMSLYKPLHFFLRIKKKKNPKGFLRVKPLFPHWLWGYNIILSIVELVNMCIISNLICCIMTSSNLAYSECEWIYWHLYLLARFFSQLSFHKQTKNRFLQDNVNFYDFLSNFYVNELKRLIGFFKLCKSLRGNSREVRFLHVYIKIKTGFKVSSYSLLSATKISLQAQ